MFLILYQCMQNYIMFANVLKKKKHILQSFTLFHTLCYDWKWGYIWPTFGVYISTISWKKTTTFPKHWSSLSLALSS